VLGKARQAQAFVGEQMRAAFAAPAVVAPPARRRMRRPAI
jgi:hypothetical protein